MTESNVKDLFKLDGKVAIITGGSGLLGRKHAEALAEFGASCILVDISEENAKSIACEIAQRFSANIIGKYTDITKPESVKQLLEFCVAEFGRVDILINNAANNPKYEKINQGFDATKRFESYPVEVWNDDIAVSLTGSFLCSQIIGSYMATHGGGVILNIASDLGIIAPDQRIYRKEGFVEEEQPTKPVTYSVVKSGLIGLTKYLATYWADKKIRANTLVPGGVYTGQDEVFVSKLTNLIPMGRMANVDEYQAAVLFLVSEASAYMTGNMLVMDGGRTCW